MDISPIFNAQQIALVSAEPVWFVLRADPNLHADIRLLHKDAQTQQWVDLVQGSGSMAVHVNQQVADLHGDSIGWIVKCGMRVPGIWPVEVQLFQGPAVNALRNISNIARYQVQVSATQLVRFINDAVQIQ